VAVVFSLVGLDKLVPQLSAPWIQTFNAIGLGQWFRYCTGLIELAGGLLFLVPRATIVGAALLIATMCGAMFVQAFVLGHPGDAFFPGLYLIAVVLASAKLRVFRRIKTA